MPGCNEDSFFYQINEKKQTQGKLPLDGKEVDEDKEIKKPDEITMFGVKISYAKAFGIAFMVLFALLFFPGIGVSSSQFKKGETQKT